MKRILILGCCGAGKSTLARSLSAITGLDIIHLDKEYWSPGWIETPKGKWEKKVSKLVQRESWIMDGNYSSSLDIRLPRADTIIYLDQSTLTCMSRVIKRIWKYRGANRPDMIAGCNERFDLNFLHYVLIFNMIFRKEIINQLKSISSTQNLYILKNKNEMDKFLSNLYP